MTKTERAEREAIIKFLRNESIIRFEGYPEQSRVLAWAANEIKAEKHLECSIDMAKAEKK